MVGYEVGFAISPAGGDVEWLHAHIGTFEAKAREGDQDMADLAKKVRERSLI